LHLNFSWTGSFPSTIVGMRKLETLGYPMVKTVFPRFDTISECDGQTDGFAIAYTVLAKKSYALQGAIKMSNTESLLNRHVSRLGLQINCS